MRTSHRRSATAHSPLEGRIVVVTGAARGLGEGLARMSARRGARVVLLGLEEERLGKLASALPGPAACWTVDVTDAEALANVAEAVRSTVGEPSVVVANAGVALGGPLMDCDPASWRRVVEINLTGSALTARCFMPDLLRTRGYYLQVASLAALAPAPWLTAYCASKSGVEGFAHALRAEVAHHDVGVGIAYLSWAGTSMIRAADETAVFQKLRTHMPWPVSVTHDTEPFVRAMVRGIERRSAHVYAPPWLRGAHAVRAMLPSVVAYRSRQVLSAEDDGTMPSTGLLGPGGAAASLTGPPGPQSRSYRPEEI